MGGSVSRGTDSGALGHPPAPTVHRTDARKENFVSPTSDSTPLIDGLLTKVTDNDPEETKEWRESLNALIKEKGAPRARFILLSMLAEARQKNVSVPAQTSTPYINTIDVADEPYFPGDEDVERTYRRWLRWNAAVMVTRAQRPGIGVGGHISSYASTATLYEAYNGESGA